MTAFFHYVKGCNGEERLELVPVMSKGKTGPMGGNMESHEVAVLTVTAG